MDKHNKKTVEEKIYELLGVKYFRKIVFWLERIIHKKDLGKNINYHINAGDPFSLNDFEKFLLYNGLIHARNIALIFLAFILQIAIFRRMFAFDYLLLLLAIKDIYCIMLQRYNYLRIKRNTEKVIEHKNRIIRQEFDSISARLLSTENKFTVEDIEFITSLRQSIKEGNVIFIDDDSLDCLRRFNSVLNNK